MHKTFVTAGAVFGGLAVALGAFGAHGMKKLTSDPEILHGYETAAQYQMYHALALLVIAALMPYFPGKWIKRAGYAFIIGIILFSGSLYLLTFLRIQGSTFRLAGPITPIGGVFFIAGWLFILIAVLRTGKKV
jgi:uncharacterized membrane protein YgdD (TMEM256/DUF423 family)